MSASQILAPMPTAAMPVRTFSSQCTRPQNTSATKVSKELWSDCHCENCGSARKISWKAAIESSGAVPVLDKELEDVCLPWVITGPER